MAPGVSNGHVTDDVTWPRLVKVVTPVCLGPIISKMAGDTDLVSIQQIVRIVQTVRAWASLATDHATVYRNRHYGECESIGHVNISVTWPWKLKYQGRDPICLWPIISKMSWNTDSVQWSNNRKWHLGWGRRVTLMGQDGGPCIFG